MRMEKHEKFIYLYDFENMRIRDELVFVNTEQLKHSIFSNIIRNDLIAQTYKKRSCTSFDLNFD